MRDPDLAEYWQDLYAHLRECDTPGCRMFCLRGWPICRDCRDREIERMTIRAKVIRERMRRAWDWLQAGAERADKAAGCLLDERRSNRYAWGLLIYAAGVMLGYAARWMVER